MEKYLIIHHSAGGKYETIDTIRDLHYPKYGRTFYDRVIDRTGKLWIEHNELNYRGDNKRSYDICVMGDFTKEIPNDDQIRELQNQIKVFNQSYEFVETMGHGEAVRSGLVGSDSTCPGRLLSYIKPMELKIKTDNHSTYTLDRANEHLQFAKDNLAELGIVWKETEDSPDILIALWSSEFTGGNCSNNKPYVINLHVGRVDMEQTPTGLKGTGTPSQVLVHEITHALWKEVGLGGMHNAPDQDPIAQSFVEQSKMRELNDYAVEKFFEQFNPEYHFISNGSGSPLYEENDMPYNEYIVKFYIATGRGLGDTEALEHWTNHVKEHGLEDAFKTMLDDYIEDTHNSIHQLDDIDEE